MDPSPYLIAAAVYDREPCARTFEEDLFLHLTHGHVVSTPEVFALFRSVNRDWPLERLRDPREVDASADTWWLWLVAGDAGQLLDWPFPPKKWVAFERDNAPRFWPYERLRRFWRPALGTGPFPAQRETGALL